MKRESGRTERFLGFEELPEVQGELQILGDSGAGGKTFCPKVLSQGGARGQPIAEASAVLESSQQLCRPALQGTAPET